MNEPSDPTPEPATADTETPSTADSEASADAETPSAVDGETAAASDAADEGDGEKLAQRSLFPISWVVVVVVATLAFATVAIVVAKPTTWDIAEIGSLGDSFGVLTSLATFFALVATARALDMQRTELGLQRVELQENRREMAKQRKALEQQAKLQQEQLAAANRANEQASSAMARTDLQLRVDTFAGLVAAEQLLHDVTTPPTQHQKVNMDAKGRAEKLRIHALKVVELEQRRQGRKGETWWT